MRRLVRVDASQREIVAELRRVGATVQQLTNVGGGCPDILVGWAGANYLLECKSPARRNKQGAVRPSEEMHEAWHRIWRGQVATVWTPTEALQAIGVLRHD